MRKILSVCAAASLLAISAAAYAEAEDNEDAQNRLGWDNVDYFKQSGQLTVSSDNSVPPDPQYMEEATPTQHLIDDNYDYFKATAVAKP